MTIMVNAVGHDFKSWLCRLGLHRWRRRPYRGPGPWYAVDTCERCGQEEPRP